MGLLDNFKPFNFDEGAAGLSVTKNGITFNKSVSAKLNQPQYVVLLISQEEKKIAIKVCAESDEHAAAFYKGDESKPTSVRWNSKDLLFTIQDMMNWKLADCNGYRVDGKFIPEEKAILFDFNCATAIL